MKQLAADESLSEEARESAKKALEVLVSSELVEIEQVAARKKRVGELKQLEFEAHFVNQQAQIEHDSALRKLEGDSEAEVKNVEHEMKKWLRSNRLQDYTADITRVAGQCGSDFILALS